MKQRSARPELIGAEAAAVAAVCLMTLRAPMTQACKKHRRAKSCQ